MDSEQLFIRKGVRADLPAIHSLIQELGRYEHAEHEITTTVEEMAKDGFGVRPLFETFLAETQDGSVVGIAFFYFGYSTWKGKKMYLDDLIVTEAYRRKGVGKMLFDRLIVYALENEVKQLRWHVLDWNTPAINFYKKLDTQFDEEWITCKLSNDQMLAYQNNLQTQTDQA